LTTRRRR